LLLLPPHAGKKKSAAMTKPRRRKLNSFFLREPGAVKRIPTSDNPTTGSQIA
jgi:hypothetical protein